MINVQDTVKKLINEKPELKTNDMLLFLEVLNEYCDLKHLIDPSTYIRIKGILLAGPKFTSVVRARRKLCESSKGQLKEAEAVKEYFRSIK